MSWFYGSSSSPAEGGSGWSLFGGSSLPVDVRQDDKPQAKTAAKPSAMRDWEQRLFNAEVDDRPTQPTWSPFMSFQETERYEKKVSKMRQMRDIGDVGDVPPLRSYEEQVLHLTHSTPRVTPRDAKTKPSKGDQGAAPAAIAEEEEDDALEGMGKAIDGHEIPMSANFWTIWPPRITSLTSDSKSVVLRPDPGSQGLALYNQERRDHQSFEVAAQINMTRGLDSAGSAGVCFQCRSRHTGIRGHVFYLEFDNGDDDRGNLVLGRLHARASKNEMPEVVKVLKKDVHCADGWHCFRVRCLHNLMLFFNYEFVDYIEAKPGDADHHRRGFVGIWSHDMEIAAKGIVLRSLEDLAPKNVPEEQHAERAEELKILHRDTKLESLKRLRSVKLIQRLVRQKLAARFARMGPYREFEKDPLLAAEVRKRTLAVWVSTFFTMQRLLEVLDQEDIKEKRMQRYLDELDKTCPPPPPPPFEPPPSPEDEELHYLYELQQLKYKKQIEQSSRKVLGKEKLEALKNMTGGSLASMQKKQVAVKQQGLAAQAASEGEHQALKQMAKRLKNNFEEMKHMVGTLKGYNLARQQEKD